MAYAISLVSSDTLVLFLGMFFIDISSGVFNDIHCNFPSDVSNYV